MILPFFYPRPRQLVAFRDEFKRRWRAGIVLSARQGRAVVASLHNMHEVHCVAFAKLRHAYLLVGGAA